jgi:hypothetical protein
MLFATCAKGVVSAETVVVATDVAELADVAGWALDEEPPHPANTVPKATVKSAAALWNCMDTSVGPAFLHLGWLP